MVRRRNFGWTDVGRQYTTVELTSAIIIGIIFRTVVEPTSNLFQYYILIWWIEVGSTSELRLNLNRRRFYVGILYYAKPTSNLLLNWVSFNVGSFIQVVTLVLPTWDLRRNSCWIDGRLDLGFLFEPTMVSSMASSSALYIGTACCWNDVVFTSNPTMVWRWNFGWTDIGLTTVYYSWTDVWDHHWHNLLNISLSHDHIGPDNSPTLELW